MRIAKSTVIFLIFVSMLSVFVANVANIINVDTHAANDTPLYEGLDDDQPRWLPPKKYNVADSTDNLMWFLQVWLTIFTIKYLFIIDDTWISFFGN